MAFNRKYILSIGLCLLVSANTIHSFVCPDDNHAFYHADVSTGCTVYHRCENSQLQTLTCPSGEAFNHATSRCEDASTVNCIETMDHHAHHHHKREVEEVHIFDIQEVKVKIVDAYNSLKPIITEILQDIAPTIHQKFKDEYLPSLRSTKEEVMPFLREKVYPQVQKWVKYTLNLAGKLIEKGYKSFKLSNSTHVSIVSMSDIVDDVSNDLKPVMQLGRYISSKMMQSSKSDNARHKREAEIPDIVLDVVSPYVYDVTQSFYKTFLGEGDSLFSRIVLPTIYDMLGDAETRYDLLKVSISAKSAFAPLMWEMLNKQTYDAPPGTVIHVSRRHYDYAWSMFEKDSKPIIRKLLEKHLPGVLRQASYNVPLLLDTVDRLKASQRRNAGFLKDAIVYFLEKHGDMLRSSNATHMNSYTLTEIMNDLTPIKMIALQMWVEYYKENKDSWLNMLIGEDSILKRHSNSQPVYVETTTSVVTPKPSSSYSRLIKKYKAAAARE